MLMIKVLDKPTRERMKRLSSTKGERAIRFTESNSRLSQKFKLPRNVLRECNTVDHISVPRKLRSAMKKRGHDSVSPPLPDKKDPNCATDGVQLPGEEGKKKLSVNRKYDLEKALITKDEEEAVETLIALAETLPNSSVKNGLKCAPIEDKSPPLAANEESALEIVEVKYPIEQSLSLTTQPVHLEPSCASISRNFESGPSTITNSEMLAHEEVAVCKRSPEIAVAMDAAVRSLCEQQFTMENSKIIGLWPGLSSGVSLSTDVKGSRMNSPGAYNPAWMSRNASKTPPSLSKNGILTCEGSTDHLVRNKSWKRCIAHVHIGHLIKGLQTAEKMNNNPMRPLNQLNANERPKQEVCVDKSVFKFDVGSSAAEKDHNETRNAILLQKRLLQDQQQPSSMSTLFTTSKQSFNFLSKFTGGGVVEATKTANETRNLIKPWSQFHVPYLQSNAQSHSNIPFSLPQSHYSTAPFTDYFPATAAKKEQMQQQSYTSNPILAPTQLGNASSPSQHQQRIWASQFVSQYKPMGLSSPHNDPNMQNRKLDPSSSIPFTESPELLHPMYIPMFPQQGHNLIPLTSSLPNTRVKTPYHPSLLSGYEGNPNLTIPLH